MARFYSEKTGEAMVTGKAVQNAEPFYYKNKQGEDIEGIRLNIKCGQKYNGGQIEAVFQNATVFDLDMVKIARNIRKGDPVIISGYLKDNSYTNKSGQKVNAKNLIADFVAVGKIEFGGNKSVAVEHSDEYSEPAAQNEDLPF